MLKLIIKSKPNEFIYITADQKRQNIIGCQISNNNGETTFYVDEHTPYFIWSKTDKGTKLYTHGSF
jgi:hypothetical protein